MTNPPLTILDLFSGIGGFSYAAERLVGGFKTVAFCEPDGACQRVLNKHWPSTPIFPDVRTLSAEAVKELCPGGLSLITAGFPCQDLSCAGKQLGYDGERSVLFYEIIRLARELRPDFLLLENVRNLLSHKDGETFQETLFQIAKAGYDAEWSVIPASDLGACHRRERIWIIAHAKGSGTSSNQPWLRGLTEGSSVQKDWHFHPEISITSHSNDIRSFGQELSLSSLHGNQSGRKVDVGNRQVFRSQRWSDEGTGYQSLSPNWRSYVSQPVLCRGDDGLSNRVDRLKQLGNSIVPQVAAVPLGRIKELAQSNNKEL